MRKPQARWFEAQTWRRNAANILNMVRKGKEDMASVRQSSLHRGEWPDEDVKPVSDAVRIVWFLLTVPFVLLSFETVVALAYMLVNVKSHTHIEVMVILLAMPLTVCVPLSVAAIAFFPSERIRRPDKWMKYWYGGWIYILLVCAILLMLYPDILYGEDVF